MPSSCTALGSANACSFAAAESLLAKNGGDPVAAFEEGQLLFNSSAIYINAMAAHHKNTSAVSTVSSSHARSHPYVHHVCFLAWPGVLRMSVPYLVNVCLVRRNHKDV